MRAVLVDPSVPNRLAIREVDPPAPAASEAFVRLQAFSLNLGEVRGALTTAAAGARPGWDLAGVVVRAAADGSGPRAGERVVGFLERGAWAERLAVPTRALAPIPDGVATATAACLPCAGLTALHALDQGGLVAGKRVLVNGASGGVGHLATQIARHAGARVVGAVRRAALVAQVGADGAHQVVVSENLEEAAAFGPYDLVVDSVGGPALGTALGLLAPGGTCVSFGLSSGQPSTFDARRLFAPGGARLYGLSLYDEARRQAPATVLARLLRLAEEGHLRPRIVLEAPWDEVGVAAARLLDRRIAGKAVLHVG